MSARRPARDDRLFSTPPVATGQTRTCPWCGSGDTVLVQRGYTGPTDEINQYFHCKKCSKVTYEIVSKTAREMRLGRFHAGGIYKDMAHATRYQVSRVLKVGINEYLLYLKPLREGDDAARPAANPR
ncbi:MAG: hypothetical protein IT335_04660 [Thermomicrobiales bacterium]|nr:hypothetical protein [Thermomicrobiales bacterium]